MKKKYPAYKQGELDIVYSKLIPADITALNKFLQKCAINSAPKKVEGIKKLVIQLADVTELPLTQQTEESVNSFLVLLNNAKKQDGSEKSNWTKDEIRIYTKGFLKQHYKNLELIENFKLECKKELNQQKITENNLVTKEDIGKMLRYAQGYKDTAYLLLSFTTGARPQELYNLTWGDIKFEDDVADVALYSGKTKKSRVFPVVKDVKKALWEWKQHYSYPDVSNKDYVFPSRWRGKAMTSAGLNKMLRSMSAKAGLKKDVWNYLMRHSQATKLYEELPQQIVEKLMGHKNMAGVYAHISSKKAREAILNKVYKIKEISPGERTIYEERLKELEEKFNLLQNHILNGEGVPLKTLVSKS